MAAICIASQGDLGDEGTDKACATDDGHSHHVEAELASNLCEQGKYGAEAGVQHGSHDEDRQEFFLDHSFRGPGGGGSSGHFILDFGCREPSLFRYRHTEGVLFPSCHVLLA